MHASRAGLTLLEVMVALVILGTAAAASMAMMGQSAAVVAGAQRAERDMRAGSALLEAVALWPAADLDRHLGATRQGSFRLAIDRTSSALYDIQLTDTLGRRVLIETSLFRPASVDAK